MIDPTEIAVSVSGAPTRAAVLPPDLVRRARWAIGATFLNGAAMATWVPLIPTVQQKLSLSTGTLGGALLGSALGSLIAMPLAGALSTRVGSRRVITAAGLVCCAMLLLPVLAPSAPLLFLALVAFGAFLGAWDVAMNAQGVAVEGPYGHPIMSSLHGFWSLGAAAAAAFSGVLAAAGLSPVSRAMVAALFLAAGLVGATRLLLLHGVDITAEGPTFARLTRPLLGLGAIAFCATMAEGSIGDWSGLYLRHVLGAAPSLAGAGYAAFMLTMTAGRLTGDRVTARLGAVPLARLGGALLAISLGLALVLAQPLAAVLGFALMGVALATIVPIAFSAAGRAPGTAPGAGIAAVSTTGYTGFLAGPPLIGVAADQLPLRGGLVIVVALGVFIAMLAPALRPAAQADATAEAGDGSPGTPSPAPTPATDGSSSGVSGPTGTASFGG